MLGGSNSVATRGLQSGLKSGCDNVKNLALGASTSLQNLYEIVRNNKIVSNADLIVTESNVNDFHNHNLGKVPIDIIEKNIDLFYEALFHTNKKAIVLILPILMKRFINADIINNRHRANIEEYGFSLLDLSSCYNDKELNSFFNFENLDHPMSEIMGMIGSNIVSKFDSIKFINDSLILNKKNSFDFFIPDRLASSNRKNSGFSEVVYKLGNNKVEFPSKFHGYNLMGVHAWNDGCQVKNKNHYSLIAIESQGHLIVKPFNAECQFHEIYSKNITIDTSTVFYKTDSLDATEESMRVNPNGDRLSNFGLIGMLLAKNIDSSIPKKRPNFKIENCRLDYLIPPLSIFKNIIQ